MNVATSVTKLIGNTPLLQAERFASHMGADVTLLVKLECFNPAGSAKDRVALAMIEQARQENDGVTVTLDELAHELEIEL